MTSFFCLPVKEMPEDYLADPVGFYTSHRREISLKGESVKESVMRLSLRKEDRVKQATPSPPKKNETQCLSEKGEEESKVAAKVATGLTTTKSESLNRPAQQLKSTAKEVKSEKERPSSRGSVTRLIPCTKVFPSGDSGDSEFLANPVRSGAILDWSLPSLRAFLHTKSVRDEQVHGGLEIVTDHRILEHLLHVKFPLEILEHATRETDPLHDKTDWQLLKTSNISNIPFITLRVDEIDVLPELFAYLMHKKKHELMKSLLPDWAIKALQPVWSEDTAPLGRDRGRSSSRSEGALPKRRVCHSLSPVRAMRTMKSFADFMTTESRTEYLDRKALIVRQRFGVKVDFKELEDITRVMYKLRRRIEDLLGPEPSSTFIFSPNDSDAMNELPIKLLLDLQTLVVDLHETMTVIVHYETSKVDRPFSTASLDPEYTHRMRNPPEMPAKSLASTKSAKRSFWVVPSSLYCLNVQNLD